MLSLSRVSPADAVLDWHHCWPVLAPAAKRSGKDQMLVMGGIVSGRYQLWHVKGQDAGGYILTSVGNVRGTDIRCCWIVLAAGQVDEPRLPTMRKLATSIEDMARADGCREIRVEGRNGWGRVLGWERLGKDGDDVIFRKVL